MKTTNTAVLERSTLQQINRPYPLDEKAKKLIRSLTQLTSMITELGLTVEFNFSLFSYNLLDTGIVLKELKLFFPSLFADNFVELLAIKADEASIWCRHDIPVRVAKRRLEKCATVKSFLNEWTNLVTDYAD